ncbi:MAG: class I SAM-dependent rRNA methyltransferase [Bacteroidota bacterium]|nr:class I SAM-dependent rRNA methyltransferase [Bacteroidota bacterium]
MTNFPKISLATGKDHSLKRFHPWVFSGAIKKIHGEVSEGDIVEVYSNKDEFLGMGHYGTGSIAVRVFSFSKINPDYEFWKSKIKAAYEVRKSLGLLEDGSTNVYRLIYAEGDGLPGLIIDIYDTTAVIQAHSIGMHNIKDHIVEALKEVLGDQLKAIFDKSEETLPRQATQNIKNGYLWGSSDESGVALENGHTFFVDWEGGQKTGFFIDQRENRELLARYAPGRRVLNTFCYTGGFSIYALNAGAEIVHSVDSSKKAITLTDKNVALNKNPERHQSFAVDTFDFFKSAATDYDLIVLDPPAFAKHHNVRHNAVMGYKRLNAEAMKKIAPGGILFTFSCSQVVDSKLFQSTVMAAAIEAGRNIRIMHHLSHPADHPINIFHPEGEYLKGLVLFVD